MNGVFIDSSVFLDYLEGKERAEVLLKEYSGFEGYINVIVFSEVMYVYIKAATGKKSYELKKAEGLITKYGLLPNDALIAATCKHYEITKIATFDADFERIDFLEVNTL